MIKAILFDVDGVLAHGEPFSACLERDYGITQEITRPFFGERFLECLIGKADLKKELPNYLQQWGWQGSVEELINYWFWSEHHINEPLIAVVQQLRTQGIPCYLATNQEKYRTAYILERMGFADQFDGIFSSAHVGCLKNDPTFFVYIIRHLKNIAADEILFWDDSPANVTVARQVGIQAELYQDFAGFEERLKLYIL